MHIVQGNSGTYVDKVVAKEAKHTSSTLLMMIADCLDHSCLLWLPKTLHCQCLLLAQLLVSAHQIKKHMAISKCY
jgi:hypothetical protein